MSQDQDNSKEHEEPDPFAPFSWEEDGKENIKWLKFNTGCFVPKMAARELQQIISHLSDLEDMNAVIDYEIKINPDVKKYMRR